MDQRKEVVELPRFLAPPIPMYEHILDRLTEVLVAVDDVLHLLRRGDAKDVRWMQPQVQRTYDEMSDLMQRLTN